MLAVEKKEEEWNTTEVREVFLWDLAGQPGYRLIHQLHLDDVTVAMIVIDSRHDLDPFAGVRHWVRALRQAERSRGDVRTPISKILVAARTDRGGLSVSPERIRSLVDELDLDGYMETSAKTGRGIMELRIRILKSVNWDTLPRITSSVEFEQIRRFIVGEKKAGLIISSVSGLLESFAQTRTALLSQEFRNTFSVCLGLMESQGMVHRFSFGGMLLTQPEYLDAYAAAVIEMAKAEPDGLGSVSESKVVAAELQLASDDRLPSGQEEKLLCIATVEELLRRELVLREVAEDGVYLVFPSQLTRERPELPEPKGKQSTFSFTGPVLSVYATLVVRLSHSGSFERTQMWKQAVTFRTAANEACGLLLHDFGEGSASLTLFFETSTREATRARFEEYVQTHLYRRAVPESVKRRPILSCPRCGNELPPAAIDDGIKRGIGWLYCPTCEPPERVRIPGMSQTAAIAAGVAVAEMDLSAERARRRSAATAALQGKIATDDFDVFLAYNHVDVEIVEAVNAGLRERGLYAWLDVEQIPPGRWFQDVIQQVIPKIRCAAMFISRAGVGRWQELELRTFTSQCVERGIPVIPVLAGLRVSELPSGLLFLKELNHVTLSKEGVDSAALDSLEWGITGKRPPV
jgi:hypothetical protein